MRGLWPHWKNPPYWLMLTLVLVLLLHSSVEYPLWYSFFLGLAAVALGRGMRRLALWAVGFELVGVLVVGTLSLVLRDAFPDETVWSLYGIGYGFVPLVLPVLGLLRLRATR